MNPGAFVVVAVVVPVVVISVVVGVVEVVVAPSSVGVVVTNWYIDVPTTAPTSMHEGRAEW